MTYKPNLNDPQVINVLERALAFVLQETSPNYDKQISYTKLEKKFGRRSLNWLKSKLLICTNPNFSKNKKLSMSYRRNIEGVEYIQYLLKTRDINMTWADWKSSYNTNIEFKPVQDISIKNNTGYVYDNSVVLRQMMKEHGRSMLSGDFSYSYKANRYWHSLQSCKKEFKIPFMAINHYNHMYDIETCAPSSLYQYAKHINSNMPKLSAIERYLKDKTEVRKELAELIEADVKDIKVLINALFSGARLSTSPSYALYRLLDDDNDRYYAPAAIRVLKENQYINQLINDIKIMWAIIEPYEFTPVYIDVIYKSTGQIIKRKKALTSRDKWSVYFKLETMIGNCIKQYLNNISDMKYFYEHDGWSCNQIIDIDELSTYVCENIGFDMKYDYEYIEYNGYFENHGNKSSLLDNIPPYNTVTLVRTPPPNNSVTCVTLDETSVERKRRLARERKQRQRDREKLNI